MRKVYRSQDGFTLVELLIVIVIIGILAGVVIGVLNPVQQQNRARDGIARSHIDKAALSTKSLLVSSPRNTNRTPTQAEFAAGLSNITAGTTCLDNDATTFNSYCVFEINNQPLSLTCTSDYTGADGNTPCKFIYYRTSDGSTFEGFRLAARGAANPVTLFVYNFEEMASGSVNEGFYSCTMSYVIDDSPVANADCNLLN